MQQAARRLHSLQAQLDTRDATLLRKFKERIAQHSQDNVVPLLNDKVRSERRASVLIPLIVHNGQLCVLLTVRSKYLSSHPGEVAFAGGKRDLEDGSDYICALREAEEEIGLRREDLEPWGQLEQISSKHGLLVSPFVCFIKNPAWKPKMNPDEVYEIFYVPLSFFGSAQSYTSQPMGQWIMHYFSFAKTGSRSRIIFGLTATLCIRTYQITYRPQALPFKFSEFWIKGAREMNNDSQAPV